MKDDYLKKYMIGLHTHETPEPIGQARCSCLRVQPLSLIPLYTYVTLSFTLASPLDSRIGTGHAKRSAGLRPTQILCRCRGETYLIDSLERADNLTRIIYLRTAPVSHVSQTVLYLHPASYALRASPGQFHHGSSSTHFRGYFIPNSYHWVLGNWN